MKMADEAAHKLRELSPEHELLQYYFKSENDSSTHEENQTKLCNRFWDKEKKWQDTAGVKVTAIVYSNYARAMEAACNDILAKRSLVLRDLLPEDANALRRLFYQSDLAHRQMDSETFNHPREYQLTDDYLLAPLNEPTMRVIVATVEDQVVGFVKVGFKPNGGDPSLKHNTILFIYDTVVDEKWRRRKIAQRMFAEAYAWGRDNGLTAVELDASVKNVCALAFYMHVMRMQTYRLRLRGPIDHPIDPFADAFAA